ncbi:MAG TPA: NUDIX domain-containing protein [Candidatus Polarisedimenticolaceae bacterium]|nr:NUDIX domain-containing protein [Candidatus Polarisedimenticolaceae bacterium]
MAKRSVGLLLYRLRDGRLEVLLVHPGGPLWKNKDLGAWSVPKGEVAAGEDELAAARREVEEETGLRPAGPFHPLGSVVQRGGKTVIAWACEGDGDPAAIRSNSFELEWPPRSGRKQRFPEIDRAAWFGLEEAAARILAAQAELLERLAALPLS